MAYNADILLGRILKVQGFDGTITVKLEEAFIKKIPRMESVFLEIEGKPVPFFIAESEFAGGDLLKFRFDGYNAVEKVNEFIGCRVFLTTFAQGKNTEPSTAGLIGFDLYVSGKKHLGKVKDIIENTGQVLLIIESTGAKEFLVPFHEDLIVSLDRKKRLIEMDLPEGLTEIN